MVTGEEESDDLARVRGNRILGLMELDLRVRLEKRVIVGFV